MTAPAAALSLYPGRTVHVRHTPFRHRFAYPICPFLFDLDRIGEAARDIPVLSHNRFNLFAFHDRDYGPRDGSPLRPWAETAWRAAGVDLEGGPIALMCFPRMLNYAFNPLTLWFGYGPDGALRGVIYEVHNTFGHAHAYVAPAREADVQRQSTDKIFHVSPFFPVRGQYGFVLRAPGERFALSIAKTMDGEDTLAATMSLRRRAAGARALLALAARAPLMTLMVTARIHWQALKLWAKGAKYHSPPAPPDRPSLVRPLS